MEHQRIPKGDDGPREGACHESEGRLVEPHVGGSQPHGDGQHDVHQVAHLQQEVVLPLRLRAARMVAVSGSSD